MNKARLVNAHVRMWGWPKWKAFQIKWPLPMFTAWHGLCCTRLLSLQISEPCQVAQLSGFKNEINFFFFSLRVWIRSRKKVKKENSFVSGTGKHRLILGSTCSDDFLPLHMHHKTIGQIEQEIDWIKEKQNMKLFWVCSYTDQKWRKKKI